MDIVEALRGEMNQTPVAKVIKATGSLKDIHIVNWIGDYTPNEGDVFFTADQLQQARADALREAAENCFNIKTGDECARMIKGMMK